MIFKEFCLFVLLRRSPEAVLLAQYLTNSLTHPSSFSPARVGIRIRLHSCSSQLALSEPPAAPRSKPEPEPTTTPAYLPRVPCGGSAGRQPHGLGRAHCAAHAGPRRPRLPQDLPGPGLQVWLRALTTEFKKQKNTLTKTKLPPTFATSQLPRSP